MSIVNFYPLRSSFCKSTIQSHFQTTISQLLSSNLSFIDYWISNLERSEVKTFAKRETGLFWSSVGAKNIRKTGGQFESRVEFLLFEPLFCISLLPPRTNSSQWQNSRNFSNKSLPFAFLGYRRTFHVTKTTKKLLSDANYDFTTASRLEIQYRLCRKAFRTCWNMNYDNSVIAEALVAANSTSFLRENAIASGLLLARSFSIGHWKNPG